MGLPSVKSLAAVFGDRAKEARDLLEKKRKTTDYVSVKEWEAHCFHRPKYVDRLMCALDEIAGTCGVEAIFKRDDDRQSEIEYLNTGDTYAPTLVYRRGSGTFRVTDIGSILERRSAQFA